MNSISVQTQNSSPFHSRKSHSERHVQTLPSAERVISTLFSIQSFDSVVDVGCGVGTWLYACRELGATKVAGIEGAWLDKELLVIDKDAVILSNLEERLPAIGKFDLAICLEVGEHLSPSRAPSFVADLTGLADTILFGAAIPGQGGAGHLNEQWQSYWARLFVTNGYRPFDVLRWRIWGDEQIKIWYRQNPILYLSKNSPLQNLVADAKEDLAFLDVVHPVMFTSRRKTRPEERKALAKETPKGGVGFNAKKLEILPNLPVQQPVESISQQPAEAVLKKIVSAIRSSAPLALIRLSHCEAKFINYPERITRLEIDRSLKRQFGYRNLSDSDVRQISQRIKDAIRAADILGVPILNEHQRERMAQGDGGMRLWSMVWPACCDQQLLKSDAMITSQNIHSVIQNDILRILRELGAKLGLLGCRDLREQLMQRGFADVVHIPVPEAARTRDRTTSVVPHYPDAFNEILGRIGTLKNEYRVYLVGAGFLGKVYSSEIAANGSVAIDVGSVMDLWAGVTSRTGHERIIDLVRL